MNSVKRPRAETGAVVLLALGALLCAAGAVRLILARHFSFQDAGICLAAIPAGMLLLLIFDYTLHHARIVSLMPLALVAMLAIRSPGFCAGMGAALIGVVAMQHYGR